MKRILAFDDDKRVLDALYGLLTENKFKVYKCTESKDVFNTLENHHIDLILAETHMAEAPGQGLLKELNKRGLDIPVIMLSTLSETDEAIKCVSQGAADWLGKPLKPCLVIHRVKEALQKKEKLRLGKVKSKRLIGNSPAFLNALDLAKRGAAKDIPVLLLGDTGTGKEEFAKAIHRNSPRSKRSFMALNCGAIPSELIESELFGHKKGAFTGAMEDKPGVFSAADGGTLFLDEVGELSPGAQVKLLRFLEDSTFTPVGGTRQRKVDIRLIFATNKDLTKLISQRKFRKDLYYRINIFPVYLPPLRERKGDIQLLTEHFLKKSAPKKRISPELSLLISKLKWEGNIRELKHFLERITIIDSDGILDMDDVPPEFLGTESVATFRYGGEYKGVLETIIEDFDRRYFTDLLERTHWNINKAARVSGLSRRSIYNKIEKLGLER